MSVRGRLVRALTVLALLVGVLAFCWPLLWLWAFDRDALHGRELNGARLPAVATRALLRPQKVSGRTDVLNGRYLARVGGTHAMLRLAGFTRLRQAGAESFYTTWGDLTAETLCRPYSRGYELCVVTGEGTVLPGAP